MAKDFQLIHLTVDEGRLKGASNRLRNQFIGCMHAHNELTILNRLLMFTMNDTGDGELHNSAQSVQMWFMLQLLAAKVFETWVMIDERYRVGLGFKAEISRCALDLHMPQECSN